MAIQDLNRFIPTFVHARSHSLAYTLVELCVSLAIVAIVLGLIVPNLQKVLKHAKMSAEINHLNAIIRFARTNAISTSQDVSICASANYTDCDNQWNHAVIVFVDKNRNAKLDADEPLLASKSKIDKSYKLKGPNRAIIFKESGDNASPTSLVLCPADNKGKYARALFISLQGRIRLSVDRNNNEIHELANQRDINCASF